jgi:hypothetical protein
VYLFSDFSFFGVGARVKPPKIRAVVRASTPYFSSVGCVLCVFSRARYHHMGHTEKELLSLSEDFIVSPFITH